MISDVFLTPQQSGSTKYRVVYFELDDIHFAPSTWLQLSRPSVAYVNQQARPSLVQIMACRLFGSKPSTEPVNVYSHWNQIYETILCKMEAILSRSYFVCGLWWRHQMETFSALLAICAGNSPVPDEFPTQRPVTRSFDVFLDLKGWVNTREAGDLRRSRAHYDVTVMCYSVV